MARVRWLITGMALICAINCSATSDGPTTVDNDDDDGTTMIPDTSPTDGCVMKSGGACNCVLTCGANKFGLDCDGTTCTCTKNGSAVGSFGQAAACTFSGDSHDYAYSAVILGCPGAYPCE